MRTRMSQTTKGIGAAVLLACLAASMAFAQTDPSLHLILQNGVQVGEIYSPPRADQGLYVEHWILYPNYVYPSADNGIKTEIVPAPIATNYKSEADFFARAPFGPGYRYVHVLCNDSTHFPRP
jgi:hypothetical protein